MGNEKKLKDKKEEEEKMTTKNLKAFGLISVEWDNSLPLVALEASLAFLILLALGFLNTIFLAEGSLGLAATSQFLMILIVFASALFVGEKALEKTKIDLFETVGFGKDTLNFGIAILFGLATAILINISNFSIITPAIQSVVDVGFQNLIFIVLFAAFIEELFFRGTLLPTSVKLLKGVGVPFPAELGLLFQAILFGVFHFGVIVVVNPSATLFDPRILVSILFGLVAGIGNGIFKSTGYSYSAHFFNNLFIVFSQGLI